MSYISHEETLALVERMEAANETARELLRDVNTASKDLRRTIREAKEVIAADVNAQINAAMTEQLGQLSEATRVAMRNSVAKVEAEFDKLANLFLGKDKDDPLEDLIRKARYNTGIKR